MLVKRRCPTWFNRGIASKSPCSLSDSKCLQYAVPAAGPWGKFILTWYVFMFVCLHVIAVCFKKHILDYICVHLQYISRYYKIIRFMLLRLDTWFFHESGVHLKFLNVYSSYWILCYRTIQNMFNSSSWVEDKIEDLDRRNQRARELHVFSKTKAI